jgi:peptidoglycan/LPS O-acetylase OafA/YrhL
MGDRPRLRGTLDFYWNRLSRVWPTWAFVTVCFTGWLVLKHVTVGGTHLHERAQPSIGVLPLLEQLGMVQLWTRPWFSGASAVGPGWSLSAEWLAYCTFPVLVLVLFRLRRCPAVVLGAAAVAVLLPFAHSAGVLGMPDFPWSWLVRIGGGFLAGALVAMCVRRVPPGPDVARRAAAVATAASVALLVGLWWAELSGRNAVGAMVVLFPVLVGSLALSDSGPGPARRLGVPWLVTGGRISFALYLVHECVFEVFWTLMDVVPLLSTDRPWAALLQPVVLLVPVPVAYLVWRFVEEPARRRMRRTTRRATPVGTPAVPAPREAPATARLAAQAGARQAVPVPVPVPVVVAGSRRS